jgi:HlyD family secretion protein
VTTTGNAAAVSALELAPLQPSAAPRRWLLALLLLGLAVAVLVGAVRYRQSLARVAPFRTVRVVRADISERVTATGTLQPVITSPVGAQVSGIVWKLHADYNSSVKAGQVLVELDPALFRNSVALATAQLAQAKANLASTAATALGAERVRDRTMELQRQSLVGNAELDASEALRGQSAGLERFSQAQVAQARAQLDRANLDLEHSIIRSPVDGTVISRNIDVGQAVAATLTAPTVFTIAQDLRHMQVHAAVDEADIGEVRAGQSAVFTVDAFRELSFRAQVHEVRNAPQTAQNVVTYDVVLDVDNADGKLRPGMTANVLILIVEKHQVTALPNEALRFRPPIAAHAQTGAKSAPTTTRQDAAVYVPRGAAAVRVSIETGVSDGNMTEVAGLSSGSEVIVDLARDNSHGTYTGAAARGN